MKNFNYFLLVYLFFSTHLLSQEIYFPPLTGDEWETINPADLDWCSDKIDSLYAFLEATDTKAFLLLKDGKIVLEKYFDNFAPTDEWYWASAAKPMMGVLTGIAQQNDILHLDDPTSNYLGNGWTTAAPEKESLITLRHHLSMTCGLNDSLNNFCTTPACLQYLADAGDRWSYHNATYYLMADVLEEATGKTLNQYFDEAITATTGIDGNWQNSGYAKVLYSTPRDFARFGLLMLNKGYWGNMPVLTDTVFFQEMITPAQPLNKAYGYYWWLNGQDTYMVPYTQEQFSGSLCPDAPEDLYTGVGASGQYLNIVPSEGLVLVRMGEYLSGTLSPFEYNNDFWKFINDFDCLSNGQIEQDDLDLHLYPNPVVEKLMLTIPENMDHYSVHVFDALGVEKIMAENTADIQMANLPQGVYWVVIRNGNSYQGKAVFKR
ncbi:MAG TPA: serine hydrolase [Saprospiraceae bacterium]|nr:serine hydrolase [Saprospiraceae bacterium]HMQ83151.1 serine hydrolase [Saprospiraceae bacterium]